MRESNNIPEVFGSMVFNEAAMEQYVAAEAVAAWRQCLEQDQPLTLEVLSDRFNFNAKYLSRLIKHKVGTGFSEYLLNLRMKRAAELLTKTDMDIKAVALEVGYEDQQYFHRIFKKKTGMTPVQYRRGMDEGKSTENSGTII